MSFMRFQNPLGAWAALAIVLVILLYLLKQQFEEVSVSSTYLWEKTLTETEASRPWQRLRRNLLLLLHILILILLIFSVMRPYMLRQGQGHETVIVLDVSMSMQATDVQPSRLEYAKKQIEQKIDAMMPSERMTIITAGYTIDMLVSRSDDKLKLKKILDSIEPQNGVAALDEALSVVSALQKEIDGLGVYVFTDNEISQTDSSIQLINLAGQGVNRAVSHVSYAYDETSHALTVLARVRNYAPTQNITLECEIDGRVIDVVEVKSIEGETASVYFKNIDPAVRQITIRLTDEDDLMADNVGYVNVQESENVRILLVTDSNIFLEKALTLRSDVELYKATMADAQTLRGYDVYIYDGYLPDDLPVDGALCIINPPYEVLGYGLIPQEAGSFSPATGVTADTLLEYVELKEIQYAKANALISQETSFDVILLNEGQSLMLAGEINGQRILIIGFDFHDTNLPLHHAFPIFVQNCLGWMAPQAVDPSITILPGEAATVSARASSQKVEVQTPSNQIIELAPPFPVKAFNQTDEIGMYQVIQKDEKNNETISSFIVTPPIESESAITRIGAGTQTEQKQITLLSNQEVYFWLILASLIIMMVEWWVYRRGY